MYKNSAIFINIFAINSATKFTDAYEPVEYRWGQFDNVCKEHGKEVKMDKDTPHLWIMGNETVLFNISNESDGNYPNKLLYQSCVHSDRQSLNVYQQESQ